MQTPKVSYITDNQGKKTFVQLSIEDWEKFIEEVLSMERLLAFKQNFQDALKQAHQIKAGKTSGTPLNDFLNEL